MTGVSLFLFRVIKALSLFQTELIGFHWLNIYQIIRGNPTRFGYEPKLRLFFAHELGEIAYFNIWLRGANLYSNGLRRRGKALLESYCIDEIEIKDGDTIIDCGANYGDLSLAYHDKLKLLNYFMIEPSPDEFKCLEAMKRPVKVHNLALAHQAGEMIFYVSSVGGDSSLIKPASKTQKEVLVKTCKLDDFIRENKIEKIKLFKLEAEGFEPEILQGSQASLRKIEFIAIDGGPERGVEKEETLSFAINFLCQSNFSIERINIQGANGRALFRNQDFNV